MQKLIRKQSRDAENLDCNSHLAQKIEVTTKWGPIMIVDCHIFTVYLCRSGITFPYDVFMKRGSVSGGEGLGQEWVIRLRAQH